MLSLKDRVEKAVESAKQDNYKDTIKIEEVLKVIVNKTNKFSKKVTDTSNEYKTFSENACYTLLSQNRDKAYKMIVVYKTGTSNWEDEMQKYNYFLINILFKEIRRLKKEEQFDIEFEINTINTTKKDSRDIFRSHFSANDNVDIIYEVIAVTNTGVLRKRIEKHDTFIEYEESCQKIEYSIDLSLSKSDKDTLREEDKEKEKLKCMLKLNLDDTKTIDFYSKVLNNKSLSDFSKVTERINFVAELPYKLMLSSEIKLENIEEMLGKEIFGMQNVKEAIKRYFVSRKVGAGKNKVLCLTGEPGTGKSMISNSIAKVFGGNLFKIDCSNVARADEFLKGHSFTFAGSASGEIIRVLSQSKAKNSVVVLEEVDKGSTANIEAMQSMLITILDPENSTNFRDHYLQTSFDLSQVTFILTCNDIRKINSVLLDRLEVIRVEEYSEEEKKVILKDYMLEKIYKENNVKAEDIIIEETIFDFLVSRNVDNSLRRIKENITKLILNAQLKRFSAIEEGNISEKMIIKLEDVENEIKTIKIDESEKEMINEKKIGISTILSVTSGGRGVVSHISSVVINDKKAEVSIAGNVSEIIKESSNNAVKFITSKYYSLNDKVKEFVDKKHSIHLQEKNFGIQKDGSSGGVSTAVAVYSAITKTFINRKKWAISGELDLSECILPIGGVGAKIDAAAEMEIESIILPETNREDVELFINKNKTREIDKKINIIFVRAFEEVIKIMFE